MAIKRRDFQKLSSTVQEFLLKLPDEEESARLRDNLLHALHFLQLYYRILQSRDKNNDPLQWNIDHSLSPLTPFKEAPDKFDWEWINADNNKLRQSLPKASLDTVKFLPQIISAIKEGDLTSLKQIFKNDPTIVNTTDAFSRDTLTYAVQYDHHDILRFLLKNGANPNNISSDGSTSLHRAVYSNRPTMVQLLLEHKANINTQDCFNRTPLHWSTVNNDLDCLEVLMKFNPNIVLKDKDGLSAMNWACHLDNIDHFKMLKKIYDREHENEPDTDNDGRTWIHWSVRKSEPFQCLNFLMQNCDSVLIKDRDGRTCLHIAAEQGALQAAKFIIDQNGHIVINEKDSKKQTPLHLATLNGQARAIKVLMDNGADSHVKDTTGASPIDYVTKRNLIFCNSIIEICLRNYERKGSRVGGASSSNSVASSFNGSESNITPAPPTTPKNTFTRSFQQLSVSKDLSGRPPRPITNSTSLNASENFSKERLDPSGELSKTAPGSLIPGNLMPPSPPTHGNPKGRPNHRGGWTSNERLMSGSMRLSRASTRTSLASDDLDRYMDTNEVPTFGGSMGNIEKINNSSVPNGFLNENSMNKSSSLNNGLNKPLIQPRISSSTSVNNRISSGRSHDNVMQSAASYDAPSSLIPPPVKPRKASSVASLNNSLNESGMNKLNSYYSNENNFNPNSLKNVKNNINYGQQAQKFNQTQSNLSYNNNNQQNVQNANNNNNNNNDTSDNKLDVVDVSEDDTSITSAKGEGFASDLSDNEIQKNPPTHLKLSQRNKLKKHTISEISPKRPTTPMEIHQKQNKQNEQNIRGGSKFKTQLKNPNNQNQSNENIQQPTGRFNEWDPFKNPIERKKSPHNINRGGLLQQQQQQTQQQQATSGFAHTFLNTDSSPRQSSGRSQLGSANKSQMSPQQNTNSDMNSSSNLDLIVSGQKLGGSRKDLSPTGTPRDLGQIQQVPYHKPVDLHRPFTRRLQPLDKLGAPLDIPPPTAQQNVDPQPQAQLLRPKKNAIDRKKLEPIRISALANMSGNTPHGESYSFSPGHSVIDHDGGGGNLSESIVSVTVTNHINDEELSISENTISSDKPISMNRNNKKKKNRFNVNQQNRKKLIEANDTYEALKM